MKRIDIKNFINILFSIFFIPISYLFPKGNIVILGTYSRHKYCENTKYLFEYLHNKEFQVFWITDNKIVMKHLDRMGMSYIGIKSPLKMLWICLRAKIIVDSGNNFFNPFNILSTKKTIKITTSHGNGPKVTVSRFHPPNNYKIGLTQIQNLYKFDYVNYPSSFSENAIGKRVHILPNNKIINLGYPRCDNYFSDSFVKEAYEKKQISMSLSKKISKKSKIILYTPTWRPYDYEFPLSLIVEDFIALDNWLKQNSYFLFFSVHTAQKPKNIPKSLKNIININQDLPLYDTNEFMLEADVLLNDYSTTSTDMAILKRPQLFFMPDYKKYSDESGFIEDYRKSLPGKEIFSLEELKYNLENIFSNQYDESLFETKRKELLRKYYDHYEGNSCEKFYSFLKNL